MTYFNDSPKPTEPRRTAAVSSGQFESGSVFRLVREIRGSAYSVGDQFMLVESEDCHDPNTLVLGGVGENYFIDPRGKPLKIEAGDTQIDSIFELVREPQREVVEEIGAEDAPIRHVTEEQFKTFREGLAGVLNEIAAVRSTGGERGERGPRGYTGVQGDKGDVGPQGPQGERGERGEKGEQGEQGERGEKGDTGERGPQGERGEPGPQGDRGEQGERGLQGERGEQGEQGQRGEKGERGEAGAVGSQGPQGERGAAGAAGADGRDGAIGPRGERGEKGERGAEGAMGKPGAKGAKGEKGDKGDTGESGVVTAKFPLVYDAAEKSISIDEERLDKILKKILGGGKVSPQDMGWLASTGGGGKVAVYINGSKITPDVRTLDFTGAGVTASKVGGKVTVNFTGTGGGSSGGVTTVNGLSGAVGITGGTDISVVPVGQTLTINYTGTAGSGVAGNNDVGVAYLKNNAVATVISVVNERAVVAGGLTTGTCFNFQKHSTTNSLQYLGAGGRFHVVASFNFWTQSANDVCGFYIGCNRNISSGLSADADRISESEVYVESRNQNKPVAGTIQTVLDLNTDDRLFFIVQNRDDTHDITVQFLKFVAVTLTSERGATGATGDTPTDYVSSFNGVTGAVEGVCAAVAGTGIFVSGSTGTVTITNTGVQSFNGTTGSINFVAQQGITLSVSGTTTSISLNYLQGASAIATTKYPEKDDWLVLQDNGSPYPMQRTQLGNISYLFLGTQATKGSGSFFRMATDIDEGAGTATDQYVSFSAIADEILNQIDGGTFA
jgi:hypothetical protein